MALDRLVLHALEKCPERGARRRWTSLRTNCRACKPLRPFQPCSRRRKHRDGARPPGRAWPSLAGLSVLAAAVTWSLNCNEPWANFGPTIAEIKRLVAQDNYVAAFAIAREGASSPGRSGIRSTVAGTVR